MSVSVPKYPARAKILVADDHPAITVVLGHYIEQLGSYEVGTTYDGVETLARVRQEKPDLLILDLGLPRQSGLEVLAAIQAEKLPTKVLIFSGLCEPNTLRACLDLGACGYLEKTTPLELIGEAMAKVLAGQTAFSPLTHGILRQFVKCRVVERELSRGQLQAMRLLQEGVNPKEIAMQLGLSLSGAYKLLAGLRGRFDLDRNSQLAEVAARYGLTAGRREEGERL